MESIGSRYATSLYEVGVEENCLEELRAQVESLGDILSQNPDYLRLLSTPVLTKAEKKDLFKAALGESLSPYLQNFLEILVDRGRIAQYPQVRTAFHKLYNRSHGIEEAVAVTAIPLSDAMKGRLTEKLAAVTGKTILLQNRVDPTILGGVRIEMEQGQLDDTVAGRLERLKEQLLVNIS